MRANWFPLDTGYEIIRYIYYPSTLFRPVPTNAPVLNTNILQDFLGPLTFCIGVAVGVLTAMSIISGFIINIKYYAKLDSNDLGLKRELNNT